MLNIDGLLTNAAGGSFTLFGPGDTATIDQLSNSGVIDLESGSILNIPGWLFNLGGDTLNNSGTLNNGGTLHNDSTLNKNGFLITYCGGTVNNDATWNNGNTLQNDGTFNQNGNFINYGGGGTINNNGVWNNTQAGCKTRIRLITLGRLTMQDQL